jgi:hypothetical protein
LASGNVVVCEVHDEVPLGNLQERSMREIWTGERYRDFRRRYVSGSIRECCGCVWKAAYLPDRFRSAIIVSEGMSPQLLPGWHGHDGGGIIWSKKNALVALANPLHAKCVRIAGVLPHAISSERNSLSLTCNRRPIGTIENASRSFVSFDTTMELPERGDSLYVELTTSQLFRPSLDLLSTDSRDLGVGLARIEVCG